ncbi:MAG: hypothetical protein HN931_12150 [Desulfobacterales bacterium]|jgi:hypothetical protein|nr:hypothetical protein [Desulfobacteraceae bacterium]MBT4364285.1 hypothetical protein [Desulfobacteraceae bacterium]MBT7086912.1 hypothetical protein [Desulfobacterales bacterium]
MAKIFRPSNRESKILSQIESSIERARRQAINNVKDSKESLSNNIAMKLVEDKLVETTNKNALEEQILKCLEDLCYADDFDVDYKIAPFRNITTQPNIVSLYVTAYVIETIINHKDVVDIFGSDEEIYLCINNQVKKNLQH